MTKTPFDKLAEYVATKAALPDTPFVEAIDALKAVTAYLTMEQKRKGAGSSDDNDEPTMARFQLDMASAEETGDGSASVRSRRRGRPAQN